MSLPGPEDLNAALSAPRLVHEGGGFDIYLATSDRGSFYEILMSDPTKITVSSLKAAFGMMPDDTRVRSIFGYGDGEMCMNFWRSNTL